jgi:CO dehydrogenase maturation factor
MKIAVTGKGGVGKSTVSGLLSRTLRDKGQKVIAIDADPDMNLGAILGVPSDVKITPIIDLKEVIAERTETKVNQPAPFFKMNPKVDDIPETYWYDHEGIKVLTMGTTNLGGGGCACPQNAFLKTLLSYLVISRDEAVILDMEAGIEHLGRGTAIGVDHMFVVVEPSITSLDTAKRIRQLSSDIGIKKLSIIGNKIQSDDEKEFIRDHADGIKIAGFIGYSEDIRKINIGKLTALTINGKVLTEIQYILENI